MLRKKDIVNARDLTYAATDRGAVALAKPGTPLGVLNTTIQPIMVPISNDNTTSESLSVQEAELQRISHTPDMQGVDRHSAELGTIARWAANRVANSIDYARNVINPLILEIVEGAADVKKNVIGMGLLTRDITLVQVNPVYNSAFLAELIRRHVTLAQGAKPLGTDLATTLTADLTKEDLIVTLSTGNGRLDENVKQLLNIDEYTLSALLLGEALTLDARFKYAYEAYVSSDALLAYLFLMGIRAGRNPSIDPSNLSETEHLEIANAINYYGYWINRRLRQYDDDLVKKTLILSTKEYHSIMVLDSVYTEYLENGGTNEAILGFMSVNNGRGNVNAKMLADLYENPDKYQSLYERVLRTNNAKDRANVNAAIDNLIISTVSEHIRENYDDPKVRKELIDELLEEVAETPYSHALELDGHVLRIVTDVLEDEVYDAYAILTGMRAYKKDNPEASVSTAALVATADLIAKWVASQIEIVAA